MKEFKFTIDGKAYEVSVNEIEDQLAEVTVNGTAYRVQMENEEKPVVVSRPAAAASAPAAAPAVAGGSKVVKSPLPGSIVKLCVKPGDKVKAGDLLLTMESMKMENEVKSEFDGVVKNVLVEQGQNVMQDDKLLEMEVAGAPAAPAPVAAPAPKAEKPAPAPAPKAAAPAAPAGGHKVTSPLPGSVIKVAVSVGQEVKKGDLLLTLESMKMENEVKSEYDGKVVSIAVEAGKNIMQEDLLLVIA